MALSGEASAQLQEGINMVLSRWTALQMAVQNNWGGPHSSQIPLHLSQRLFDVLTNSTEKVYDDNVVPILKHSMDYLNTDFVDEGIEYKEIAVKLLTMHEECLKGNFNSIERLKEAYPPRRVPYYIQQDDSDNDILSDDDSLAMIVDAPETGSRDFQVTSTGSPQTDDGWTVVGGSRRNRGRRN